MRVKHTHSRMRIIAAVAVVVSGIGLVGPQLVAHQAYADADTTAPVFTPAKPEKLVARAGRSIADAVHTVAANDGADGTGVNSDGVVIDAKNLDLANPKPGTYSITYRAVDNANNKAEVTREVEITTTEKLEAKLAEPMVLDGYSPHTRAEAISKQVIARAVVADETSPQAAIDKALQELQQAIDDLRVDHTDYDKAKQELAAAPAYVAADKDVAAAATEADRLANLKATTTPELTKATKALTAAIATAIQEDQARQKTATQAVDALEAKPDLALLATTQAVVDTVKDDAAKAALQRRVDAVRSVLQPQQPRQAAAAPKTTAHTPKQTHPVVAALADTGVNLWLLGGAGIALIGGAIGLWRYRNKLFKR